MVALADHAWAWATFFGRAVLPPPPAVVFVHEAAPKFTYRLVLPAKEPDPDDENSIEKLFGSAPAGMAQSITARRQLPASTTTEADGDEGGDSAATGEDEGATAAATACAAAAAVSR